VQEAPTLDKRLLRMQFLTPAFQDLQAQNKHSNSSCAIITKYIVESCSPIHFFCMKSTRLNDLTLYIHDKHWTYVRGTIKTFDERF
jgi:hypothetical protein